MAAIDNLVTDAVMMAQAYIAELLTMRQVKPGDKLLLKETVKETDVPKPFSLAKTYLCVCPHYAVLFPPFLFPPPMHAIFFYKRKDGACVTNTLSSISFSPTVRPRKRAHK